MIYKEIIKAKNGTEIPIFSDGKSFHSKYNPEREAVQLVQNIEKSDFFLVTGLGAAFHIKELQKKFPDSFILVVENSESDIEFLKNLPEIKNIFNKKTQLCTLENIETNLQKFYLPAKYSTFSVFTVNSWIQEIDKNLLLKKINSAISKISADFSVQAHFGKIWQTNILNNLKFANQEKKFHLPTEKICLICAAGPSLEQKIEFIKKNREKYYILSTDTAFKTLSAENIFSDAVISIDGQMISYSHFAGKITPKTLFIFELMANHSAVKKIKKNTENILFTISMHPFEQLLNLSSKNAFFETDSTSGTVTIAALDFAKKAGFSSIEIFGADFGYINNKAYAKGTYLDKINYSKQTRISSAEKEFSRLMFRTELINISENKKTTETLRFYKENLFSWCKKNCCKIEKNENPYKISNSCKEKIEIKNEPFNLKNFFSQIQNPKNSEQLETSLLPYISWLKNSGKNSQNNSFNDYTKLALKFILRYNL